MTRDSRYWRMWFSYLAGAASSPFFAYGHPLLGALLGSALYIIVVIVFASIDGRDDARRLQEGRP